MEGRTVHKSVRRATPNLTGKKKRQKSIPASSPDALFRLRARFLSIFGSRPAPKMASGTRPERFKSFVDLGGVSKTVPTGSWEPPGRLSGGLRAPPGSPGAPFWDDCLTIFEVDFDMKSYSDILFFEPVFFVGSFAWARDSD